MRSDINLHEVEFGLPRKDFMWDLIRPAAAEVKADAVLTAPVQKEKPHGGDRPGMYKASLYARQDRSVTGMRVYQVGSRNKVAWWVESGSHHGKQAPQHILLNACRKAGLRISDIRR